MQAFFTRFISNQKSLLNPIKTNCMKKIFLLIIYTLGITVLFYSCSKDITGQTDHTPALNPSNLDMNAGTWKPVLLTGPSEFAVAAPVATTSPDYIAQINEIKTWQANATND